MYLKRLEMNGFKSFVEARIVFQQGITAVVGPNGSGKSNILDAVLWVLGEQSTKTLRSERMEDVIFNGTESRKPQGMVEVSLILGDVDRQQPASETLGSPFPYSLGECQEVMVTRRLFRDGASEYFINQVPCRLKDLRALLLDTRAGSKGHTVIEQGMIDRILNASPIERRELIEETAGIIRYKKQKGEALRKLEGTNQNLLRVRDIVNEVKRQLASLERQAKTAEAYRALKQEVRRLELMVLIHDYQQIVSDRRDCLRVLSELSERETAEEAAGARVASEIQSVQLEAGEHEAGIAVLRDAVGGLEARVSQAATTIELLSQRLSFLEEQKARMQNDLRQLYEEKSRDAESLHEWEERMAVLTQELAVNEQVAATEEGALSQAMQGYRGSQAALEAGRARVMNRAMEATVVANQMTNNQTRGDDLTRRIEKLEQQRIQAETALHTLQEQLCAGGDRRRADEMQLQATLATVGTVSGGLAELKQRLADAEDRVSSIQEELTVSSARQHALRAITRGVVPLLADPDGDGGTLAHVLTVRAEYDVAIEAVLGSKLLGTLVDTPQEAARLLETLQSQDAVNGTFLPRRPRVLGTRSTEAIQHEGIIGRALDVVSPKPGYEELVSYLLAGVFIVRSLEEAVGLWENMTESSAAVLVTVRGEILTPDGTLTASPAEATIGVIARERELRVLTDRIPELEQSLHEAKKHRSALEEALTDATRVCEARELDVRRLEIQLVSLRKDEERGQQDLSQLRQRIEALLAERHAAEAERDVLRAAAHVDREALLHVEAERDSAEQALAGLQAAVSTNEQIVESRQAAAAEVRLKLAGLTERLEQSRSEIRRIQGLTSSRETRLSELEGELSRLRAASTETLEEQHAAAESVPAVEAELAQARHRLTEAQMDQAGRTVKLRALEAEHHTLRQASEDVHRQQEAARLREREADIRLEGYEAQLQGTYQVSIEAAITEVGDRGDFDVVGARDRLIQRRSRLEDLGPVNVMAIEEHRELEERLQFLTAQEADLGQSVASLKAIIAKINRTTKQLFLTTFAELQVKFDEMFRSFFDGGRAELLLVEEEEGAEPGVDIVAQPPGKRLKNITMLSGGERALTAMALVFASFVIRPTPFCVLDEIDAPLDEENTGRFTRVLQSLSARSQFIVITHSKQTMEVADSLYGVTMQEPGISSLVSVRLNKLLEPVGA